MTLATKAKSGVKWTTLSTVIRAISQLALLALAARYLGPEALGHYALLLLVLGFAQLFMDMGLGNAVIHHDNVSQDHINQLFTVNLVVAIIVAMAISLIAPLLALFFNAPELTALVLLVAPAFIISALFRMHLVVLQKQLAFKVIAKIEISAQLVAVIITFILLLNNIEIKALVFGYLTNITIQGAAYWLFSPTRIRPKMPESVASISKYLNFGVFQTADGVINYINSQFDVLIVGKILGTEVLGGYNLARQFCFRPAMVINPILTRVAFPVMARLQKSEKLPKVYTKLVTSLALINFPLYLFLAVFTESVIEFMFGEQWLIITTEFRLLAIWCLIRSCMNPVGSLFMAIGKVKQLFNWNLSLTLIFPSVIIFGAQFGVVGVGISLVITQFVLLLIHTKLLLNKAIDLSICHYLQEILKVLLIASFSAVVTYAIIVGLENFIQLTVWFEGLIFIGLYGGVSWQKGKSLILSDNY